ncbi:alpha/beta hydrolase family protein [Winogradskyella flava]|uniref:Alpha/beta fold hydrolase n=1 Tax=Winogradskyella flava TaxID=1884876 RepID=A0A842ISZ2_9FLAO|nr:alpha/beta fold hydrolase [Winogradskyella flava]MBC2843978.1 alpha/beta fold hydrolase [Winogradskyella flava]
MDIERNIILERKDKKPILIDAFYSETLSDQPIIIFCHGYKGFKDWGAWNLMAKSLASSGFCVIKFNFSHNGGTVENPIDFPDLEAFGNNNYTKELDDLNDVLDWTQKKFLNHTLVDSSKICLVGHSRGGGIVILKASEDNRVTKLVTLASVSDFGRRTATIGDLEEWKATGVKFVLNGRTKQQMPHYYQFYENFMSNKERLDIASATERIQIPMLIIHGDNDTSVSIKEAEELHQWNPDSQLKIIKNADHVFNTRHPWGEESLSVELKVVVESIIDF